jgi:CheY-like chemotaxis protein
MKTHKNILLIEDDHDDQYLFKAAIENLPETKLVHIAGNGKEALDWLNATITLPDIIFTDINMPVMSGIECFKKIMNTPVFHKLPVVFLSSDIAMIEYVGTLGAKMFITKGIDTATMKTQIERAIKTEYFEDTYKPYYKHVKKVTKTCKPKMIQQKV